MIIKSVSLESQEPPWHPNIFDSRRRCPVVPTDGHRDDSVDGDQRRFQRQAPHRDRGLGKVGIIMVNGSWFTNGQWLVTSDGKPMMVNDGL